MFSCQIPPDIPPFEITTTVLDNGNSVRVDWPLVNDSRLGTVRYDVFLGNSQLASNITTNTFTINNLAFNTTYTGTLVGKASTGDTESMDFTFATGKEYVFIPDVGFEQALITGGQDTEGILNSLQLLSSFRATSISCLLLELATFLKAQRRFCWLWSSMKCLFTYLPEIHLSHACLRW